MTVIWQNFNSVGGHLIPCRVWANFSLPTQPGFNISYRMDFQSCYLDNTLAKVHSFLEDSCAILISSKSVVIFADIFADFVLISAKMTTLLKEMRIAQLSSKNKWTLKLQKI